MQETTRQRADSALAIEDRTKNKAGGTHAPMQRKSVSMSKWSPQVRRRDQSDSSDASGSSSANNPGGENAAVLTGNSGPTPASTPEASPPKTTAEGRENGTVVYAHGRLGECFAKQVHAGEFEAERHFYAKVLNANIHPMVASFMTLGNERIATRYAHLNPQVDANRLRELLAYSPRYFSWAGSDLFNVTTADGRRHMIVVETNSCPSGQKSMPLLSELGGDSEFGGYGTVLKSAFRHRIEHAAEPGLGALAVVYDKNPMEASGYAAALAEVMGEPVWLTEWYDGDPDPPVRFVDGVMSVRDASREWHPIRATFRYVTQKPWNRIPLNTRTVVINSIVACLAGGRNKFVASRAYDYLNAELIGTGLRIRTPETVCNVRRDDIPGLLREMGGHAVVKIPYSNAGQGVFTITNERELAEFMAQPHHYEKYIVQALVGNADWSSKNHSGTYFHVGTVPDRRSQTYASDLRMMVVADAAGFRPVALYARRARLPLAAKLHADAPNSWDMLGTNLSIKLDGSWGSETGRLLLVDRKDFNSLGIGIDDLIDAYVQTVLSVIAIDKMCQRLMRQVHVAPSGTLHQASSPRAVEVKSPSAVAEGSQTALAKAFLGALPSPGTCRGSDSALDLGKVAEALDSPSYAAPPGTTSVMFDFELFEALNPDPALLREIQSASGGQPLLGLR